MRSVIIIRTIVIILNIFKVNDSSNQLLRINCLWEDALAAAGGGAGPCRPSLWTELGAGRDHHHHQLLKHFDYYLFDLLILIFFTTVLK